MNTCALDCPCGCEGISGTNGCTCATSCACGTTSNTWTIWYNNNNSPTISLGDIVVWTNSYSSKHTVSSDDKIFESGDLFNEDTFEYQFNSVGEFDYHCFYHSISMTGTIVVAE